MRLTNILREIEDEEDNIGQNVKIPTNMVLIPINASLQDLEKALNDDSNYEAYSRNVQNVGSAALQSKIESEQTKIFGPTGKSIKDRTPPAKVKKAKELWDAADAEWRKDKAKDIKSRFPEFDTTGWEELEFDELPKEAKKYNVFWDFITGPKLDALIKKVTSEFSTQENPLNWKEEDGRLVFPPDVNPKFEVIEKTVNTVMKNAGVSKKEYKLKPEDIKGFAPPKQEIPSTPQPAGPSVLTLTLDPDKIKGKKPELNAIIKLLKNTYDQNFDYDQENSVIKITNIKPERRADVRSQFAKFLKPVTPVKENFDFERYQMLRRAGIIK
jgi:hypothetical protein